MDSVEKQSLEGNKLNLIRLIGIVIGSTIGGGVFSISGDMAANGANTGAVLIGWSVCGIGMLGLTMCFYGLSLRKKELTGGIFSYAKEGFGTYIGFNSAWGYWISVLLCNVSYATLLFSAIGYFIPAFGQGNNLLSIVCASLVIWTMHFLVLKGVKEAASVNLVIALGKLVPILIFVVALVAFRSFDFSIFKENFWGQTGGMPLMEQIKATMYTTVWAFIGIEGAVAISGRAEKNTDVAKATVGGFLGILLIYLLVSILSMGVMTTPELAALKNPPLAYILESVVGKWGAAVINIGVIVSLAGSTLGYTIIAGELPYVAAQNGVFNKAFKKQNRNNSPVNALLLTNGIIQLFLIITYLNESTYQIFYTLSASMVLIPYLLSAAYYLKLVITNETFENSSKSEKTSNFIVALLGTLYSLWLIYSGGLEYMLITAILYIPGTIVYTKSRKENGNIIFEKWWEKLTFIIILAFAVISLVLISNGTIQPF